MIAAASGVKMKAEERLIQNDSGKINIARPRLYERDRVVGRE